ncbi:MAG: FG-GAP-like repeat-containing protein, partial [Candidatus Cloacimonetes bacterium]|nr:FG-GAP-like repeat-containing protein [Candidatus Cloacimonadota bacterium]
MKKILIFVSIFLLATSSFAQIDFTQYDITTDYLLALDAYPEDIDGDGDMDFVSTASQIHEVSWWENDGNQNFTQHFVSDNLSRGRTVIAVDIDEDGDMDFLGAGWDPGIVIWWENDGNQNFTEFVIDNTFWGAHTVAVGDMDNDDDIDVLCSAYRGASGEIAWWENDGYENFTIKHTVNDMSDRNPCVYAIDINNDGFMDVVGCGYNQGDVSWWENNGEQEFTEHVIGTGFNGAHWIHADDIDGDGDNDVVGAAYAAGKVTWWENLGNETFSEHLIDNIWNGSAWVHIKDMDNDDDMDIIAVAEISNAILWWENDGDENFTDDPVVVSYNGAFSAYPADMDKDGDMDVLASASSSNRISWFESDLYQVNFEANPLTGHFPLEVQFSDESIFSETITSWFWDFDNDGVVDSNEQHPTFTYDEPGTYSVNLMIMTESFSKSVVYENYIQVFNGESALSFDGNGYAMCDAAESLNFSNEFTFEAWINPT